MARYRATITVTLKSEILDPAGEATQGVLHQMGFSVEEVRIGRHITATLEASDSNQALEVANAMAKEVLANPVMEIYQVDVVES